MEDYKLSSVGVTHYEHQTSIEMIIDGEAYWFTVFARGADSGSDVDYDIENYDDLSFELTKEIKDKLIDEFLLHEANFR